MNKFFIDNRFYPQNFFLYKQDSTDLEALLDTISGEASKLSPESFDATVNHFTFVFRYHPPYTNIQEFPEMRRLQECAMSHTRFKEEYNGYIAIDLSEWQGHTDEEHFENCMSFLRDMAENWKYVFFTKENDRDTLMCALKKYLWVTEITDNGLPEHTLADKLSAELERLCGKKLNTETKEFINAAFKNSLQNDDSIKLLAYDMFLFFGNSKETTPEAIKKYISSNHTYAYAIMNEEERAAINTRFTEKEKK